MSAVEFVGPCRFAGWAARDMPEIGVMKGEPVAKAHPRAWIQIAAVAESQSKNTMTVLAGLWSKACIAEHGIDPGKTIIYAYGGTKRIETVTSSPRTLEGNRPTFVIQNEALSLDTPIPSPTGWTTVGKLRAGDVIYGADGSPTRVTKVHPIQYGRRVFEVVHVDGTVIKASDGHLWQTRVAASAAKPRVRTTLEMFEDGRRFMTPRPGPRAGIHADLPVDPYILGAWLGDGSSGACNIAVGRHDEEAMLAEFEKRGVKVAPLACDVDRPARRWAFSKKSGGFGAAMGTDIARALRSLPCYRDKHIPRQYLEASVEQRLELLRGLMDTDGCMSTNNQAIFVGRERLARDVLELLRSLGQVAHLSWVKDERSREGGYARINFTPAGIQPFAYQRKAERVKGSSREWISIKEIREIPSEPVRCISVDAPDSLFQAGEAGHVTHNTHHWLDGPNNGAEMAKVIARNVTKAKGGQARRLSITNAYAPSEDSVARRERSSYEKLEAKAPGRSGIMYDSLEAPSSARLLAPFPKNLDIPSETRRQIEERYLSRILEATRGGAYWYSIKETVSEIMDPESVASDMRRFYFNQVVAAEDAWVHPAAVDASISQMAKEARQKASDDAFAQLEAGWLVGPDEPIVMFGDMSKSDDSTGLVGCRLSDGYVFTIGVWNKPAGDRGKGWLAPRHLVDKRVDEAFKRFNIVAFWVDPSHTKDETDDSSYWSGYLDKWHRTYKDRLDPLFWPVKSGIRAHSVNFDMSISTNTQVFIKAAEQFVDEMETVNDVEEYDGSVFQIDGYPTLVQHLKNAVEHYDPRGWGTSLAKDGRESPRKIDLAVCAVGARMLRRVVLNVEKPEQKVKEWGEIW